jgi:hypothetical protein
MNITENLYIQLYYKQHLLINEQNPAEETPLFKFITSAPLTPTYAGTNIRYAPITQSTRQPNSSHHEQRQHMKQNRYVIQEIYVVNLNDTKNLARE